MICVLVSVLARVDDVQSSTRPEVTCGLSELMSLRGGEVQPGLRRRGSRVTRVDSTVSDVSWSELEVTVRIEAGRGRGFACSDSVTLDR